MPDPKFKIGQLVTHNKFGYRGVVYDVDLEFGLSEAWYEQVARSRPPKDQPWYRVLVDGGQHETYVAERHLELDRSGQPIDHPLLGEHFDVLENGYYARQRNLN